MKYEIKVFNNTVHRFQVMAVWKEIFGYATSHNEPGLVIDKKLETNDGLFFVAVDDQKVIGTIMAGYDGHRGWIYAVAVLPDYRKQGIGSQLLAFAEQELINLGCMKVNLQVMQDNAEVEKFYLANGYQTEQRISMGKRFPQNI